MCRRSLSAIRGAARPVVAFCRDVIDATHDLVATFKPQFAHFAAADALGDLKEIIAYCRELKCL